MLGYSERPKGYRVYNTETNIVEEEIHVKADDMIVPEMSKLDEKLAGLKIIYSNSEGVQLETKPSAFEVADISEDIDKPKP